MIPEKMIKGRLNIIVPNARGLIDNETFGVPDPCV